MVRMLSAVCWRDRSSPMGQIKSWLHQRLLLKSRGNYAFQKLKRGRSDYLVMFALNVAKIFCKLGLHAARIKEATDNIRQ